MIQETLGLDSFATWDNALKSIGIVVLLYAGRGMQKVQKEMTEWRVFLFGITGTNGLNSRVEALEKERDERLTGRRHVRRRDEDA